MTRTGMVWAALIGAMTTVGALLFALDGKRPARIDGLALPALISATRPSSIDGVFRTRTPLDSSRWQAIVIHHSGSMTGSPASLENQAKANQLNGLGYHFVVGNGQGMEDGEIHVGYRWLDQLPGAHAAGKDGAWYNHRAIGICLVGNGDRQEFSAAQIDRLGELVRALSRQFSIPEGRIVMHSQIAPTSDPGILFPAAAFRQQIPRVREPRAASAER